MSANLDAAAFAPEKVQSPRVVDVPEIAARVAPAAGLARVVRKRGRIELGAAPIPGADVRTANDDLAGFTDVRGAAVIASNFDVHPFNAPANRNDGTASERAAMIDNVLRNEARLGGGELVDQNAVPQCMPSEKRDIVREHRLAAEIDRA